MSYKFLKLEPKKTTPENLFYWIKSYYVHKFLNAKQKTEVPNDFDLSALVYSLLRDSTDTMGKVIKVVNMASKGLVGVNASHSTFRAFYRHIQDDNITSMKEVNQQYVENFILSVNHQESNTTKERYYTHLKALFNFIQDHNLHDGNKPHIFNIGKDRNGKAKKILHIRKEHRPPVYLTTEEIQVLNKRISEKNNPNYKDNEDMATQILVIRLLMFGLISISELQQIKATDFITVDDVNVLELKVGGRIIPLPRRKLIKYINILKDSKKCEESEYFFCMSKSLKHISNRAVGDIIKKQFEYAKIKKPKTTANVLRASGTIYLNRKGISDKKLQELRGDKTVLTVQILLKSAITDHYSTASMFDELVN